MSNQVAAYPDWKAPPADGDLLIWPSADQLLSQTMENHRRLNHETGLRIQNVPLAELRRHQRKTLGQDAPLIVSGHQTELYHAGVWAKDVLAGHVADRLNGGAYHVAVDTDHPKHLSLRWPGGAAPISDDNRIMSAAWSGLLDCPTPAYLNQITTRFHHAAAGWEFSPSAFEFLSELGRHCVAKSALAGTLTGTMQNLDLSLGLRHQTILASPLFDSLPYLAFAHHLMAHADSFAAQYNAALAEYRRLNKVRSATRPMPDLSVGEGCCEIPFWHDDLNAAKRVRAGVKRIDGQWALMDFRFDPAADGWEAATRLREFLHQHQLRLSPRALTLTLFMRLLLADQFVHGIGGGRYDQVTDSLIASYFGIAPPHFCVTTATLYFPAAAGRSRVCLPCLQMEGHRLKHAVLGDAKKRWLEEIAAAPRHGTERQIVFSRMHGQLAEVWVNHAGLRNWERRYEAAVEENARDQAWFDRELFYAIQPRDRLLQTIGRYDAAFA